MMNKLIATVNFNSQFKAPHCPCGSIYICCTWCNCLPKSEPY